MAEIDKPESSAPLVQPKGAGGTPGGVGEFFAGLGLTVLGGWLILNQVKVVGAFNFFGIGSGGFGLTMLPLLAGIGVLFFSARSTFGWMLVAGGMVAIGAAVLMNLSLMWAATSLFNTILMFGMFAAGLGLIGRSLRAQPPSPGQ